MNKPLCIYHAPCADGFTAAWAVHQAMDCEFYAASYSDKVLPDVTNRDVIMVDFSYKKPVLLELASKARGILILDHHDTAMQDLAGFEPLKNINDYRVFQQRSDHHIRAVFDMERSGAGIAWDFFHPDKKRPALIDFVEDRDLWKFKLGSTRAISAFVFSYDYTFENWDNIAAQVETETGQMDAVIAGTAIDRKLLKDVRELVAGSRRRILIDGHEIWAANLPYTLTSDAGGLMAQGQPFAACYRDEPEVRVYSLRSVKGQEGAIDVGQIAKKFGGGGHKNAAGFKIPLTEVTRFEIPAGGVDAQNQ